MINSTTQAQPKQYIVVRHYEGQDNGPMGSGPGYDRFIATEHPNPGEEIYHGPFKKEADYGDMGPYTQPVYYYVPVDPKKITHETYMGAGNVDVQVF